MNITAKHFKRCDLLYMVAKVNVPLAIQIAKEFGGLEYYIVKWDTIRRQERNQYIVSQRGKLVGNKTLAKELNLSSSYVRHIHGVTKKKK